MLMQPIADMEDDDFMKLQALYGAELPICPICSLEDARHVLSELLFDAPKDTVSDAVHHTLEDLFFVVIGALVSNWVEAEQEDQSSH